VSVTIEARLSDRVMVASTCVVTQEAVSTVSASDGTFTLLLIKGAKVAVTIKSTAGKEFTASFVVSQDNAADISTYLV
jgi:hypothetical protein